jgi:hypothetical protein
MWHDTRVMEKPVHPAKELVLDSLKRRFSHIPPGISLAEELIAERRAEARREEQTIEIRVIR